MSDDRRVIGAAIPEWAEGWVAGRRCGCGARLCLVACYCGGHYACSRSAMSVEKCAESRTTESGANDAAQQRALGAATGPTPARTQETT